jgi:hypothetical protein
VPGTALGHFCGDERSQARALGHGPAPHLSWSLAGWQTGATAGWKVCATSSARARGLAHPDSTRQECGGWRGARNWAEGGNPVGIGGAVGSAGQSKPHRATLTTLCAARMRWRGCALPPQTQQLHGAQCSPSRAVPSGWSVASSAVLRRLCFSAFNAVAPPWCRAGRGMVSPAPAIAGRDFRGRRPSGQPLPATARRRVFSPRGARRPGLGHSSWHSRRRPLAHAASRRYRSNTLRTDPPNHTTRNPTLSF